MEKVKNIYPIAGMVQHGEQQFINNKKKVVELGYFIAKTKNENMQFLIERFNEKYKKQNKITIRFFSEDPLTVRRIRYNQGGAACYCMKNSTEGRQKVSKLWEKIECTENCKHRIPPNENSKPACNLEGTLKFLLPDISTDRIWLMKITGKQSRENLENYINLQKSLGNSLKGDYVLFLKQEEQTNKQRITFKNQILDIMKKEDFISNTPSLSNQINKSTNVIPTTNNELKKDDEKAKKQTEKNTTKKVSKKSKKDTTVNDNEIKAITNVTNDTNNENDLSNSFLLVDISKTTLNKDGKPKEYCISKFIDINGDIHDVFIPPQFEEELMECNTGTNVILDLQTKGDKTFTNSIKYIQKIKKQAVA